MKIGGDQVENKRYDIGPFYEVLTAEELAARWRVPETWVREQTRSRSKDPLPHIRLGRYVRFISGAEMKPAEVPIIAPLREILDAVPHGDASPWMFPNTKVDRRICTIWRIG